MHSSMSLLPIRRVFTPFLVNEWKTIMMSNDVHENEQQQKRNPESLKGLQFYPLIYLLTIIIFLSICIIKLKLMRVLIYFSWQWKKSSIRNHSVSHLCPRTLCIVMNAMYNRVNTAVYHKHTDGQSFLNWLSMLRIEDDPVM